MSNVQTHAASVSAIVVGLIDKGHVDLKNVNQAIRTVADAFSGIETPAEQSSTDNEIVNGFVTMARKKDAVEGLLPYQRDGKTPAVQPQDSIKDDGIICLDDGKMFKTLKRHLTNLGYASPAAYRAYWGLPVDYPMVAPSYSKARSKMAKDNDFGKKTSTKPKSKKSRAKQTALPDWLEIKDGETLVEATVKDDFIICLEDGAKPTYIRGYVNNHTDMTWEEYLSKWNLPADYPKSPHNFHKKQSEARRKHGVKDKKAA